MTCRPVEIGDVGTGPQDPIKRSEPVIWPALEVAGTLVDDQGAGFAGEFLVAADAKGGECGQPSTVTVEQPTIAAHELLTARVDAEGGDCRPYRVAEGDYGGATAYDPTAGWRRTSRPLSQVVRPVHVAIMTAISGMPTGAGGEVPRPPGCISGTSKSVRALGSASRRFLRYPVHSGPG